MTRRIITVLLAAVVLRLIVTVVAPVLDPTEGRYSEIAHTMADSGDWVTPRLWVDGEHIPFLGKPPLFFWTAALSIRVFGANEFAVRLPSSFAGAALLILMYVVVSRYLGRSVAASATLMTLTSALFFFIFGSVVVDMHLAFFVAGALFAYLAFTLEPSEPIQKRWSLLCFLLLAGGFLTKGPVALVLFGLPVFLWTAHRRTWGLLARHAWWAGISVFHVLVVPWFVVAEIRNPGFLHYFFVNENLLRYLKPGYGDLYGTGHQFTLGSAILMFIGAAFPWSIVAIRRAAKIRRAEFREILGDDVQSFLVLGFSANLLFWCFARQLLPTYMAPMIPLFCTWIVVNCRDDEVAARRGDRLAVATIVVWFGLLVAAAPASSADSTRGILREAERVAWELNIPSDVTFANRTSQSAMFYAPDTVHNHPKEDVGITIERVLDTGRRHLLIIHREDLERVPNALLNRMIRVGHSDGWFLYVTRVEQMRLQAG